MSGGDRGAGGRLQGLKHPILRPRIVIAWPELAAAIGGALCFSAVSLGHLARRMRWRGYAAGRALAAAYVLVCGFGSLGIPR